MDITTTYKSHPVSGRGQIIARGIGGKQKTTNYDHSLSTNANHGVAAANLIISVNAKLHPLERQNGDDLRRAAIRSIDGGYSSHSVSDDGKHRFSV